MYTWDHKSSNSFWGGMKVSAHPLLPTYPFALSTDIIADDRQPILADEIQTFKALITIHKVLQEGHPVTVREAQSHASWLESLVRGVAGDGIRGETVPGTVYGQCMPSGTLRLTLPP